MTDVVTAAPVDVDPLAGVGPLETMVGRAAKPADPRVLAWASALKSGAQARIILPIATPEVEKYLREQFRRAGRELECGFVTYTGASGGTPAIRFTLAKAPVAEVPAEAV